MVALIYALVAVVCLWLAARAWRERSPPGAAAFALLAAQAGASSLLFGLYLSGLSFFVYPYAAITAFVPVSLMRVFERLFGDPHPSPRWVRLRVVTAVVVVAYGVTEPFLGGALRASVPEVVLGAYVVLAFVMPLGRLWRAQRGEVNLAARGRARILFGLLGTTVIFFSVEALARGLSAVDAGSRSTLGPLAYAWALQGDVPPIGPVLFTGFLYVLQRVVAGALDAREIVARAFTLSGASLALVVVQELVLDAVGQPGSFWTHQTFLLFLVGWAFFVVYDPLQRFLTRLAGEWLNRPGWLLHETLAEVDRSLAKVLSLSGLESALIEPILASGRARQVGLYLWQPEQGLYRLALQRGEGERALMSTISARPFTDGFQRGTPAYVRTELRRVVGRMAPGHEEASDQLRVLDVLDADLAVPFMSRGVVMGWLTLSSTDAYEGFAPQEVRKLRGTVDRAAIVLENLASVEQLTEQRRLAALGTMAAGLAHEIRNPLAGIKGAAQYLQGQASPEDVHDFLNVIVGEVNRLNDVVSQFLDYARPLKINAESTEVAPLLERVLELVRRDVSAASVNIIAELAPELPVIRVDRDKLKQVLLNLIQNAVQAAGPAGEVRVAVSVNRTPSPEGRGEQQLSVTVSDTGPGIMPEDLEKLFVPFFTTKTGGTGLGLAISRRLIQAHGGDITVRAEPGQPTQFSVRLPVSSELSA